jgi:hypothetical protein
VRTLTLFNALSYVQDSIEEIKVDLAANGAGMPADEHSRKLYQLSRLVRQRVTFKDAIRARLTPPAPKRQRVNVVTIGREYANVHRINADDYGFYRLTPASRNRLIDACSRMMDSDGVKHGIVMFSREVPQS